MAKFDLDDLVQLAGLLNNKEKEEKTELESLLDVLGGSNKKDDEFDLSDLTNLLGGSKKEEPDLTTLVTLLGKTNKKENNDIDLSSLAGLFGNSKKEDTIDADDLLALFGKKEEKKESLIKPEMLVALAPILLKIAKDADLADKIKDLLTDDKKKKKKKTTSTKKKSTSTKKKTSSSTKKKTTAKKTTTTTKKVTTTKKTTTKKANADSEVISYVESASNYTANGNASDETFGQKAKRYFITVVDFIFYDGEIKGYKWDELTTSAKAKVVYYALKIDSKIDEKFPDYKNTISTKYNDIKAKLVAKYLDITNTICSNSDYDKKHCDIVKQDFELLKKSVGITWDIVVDAFKYAYDKSASYLKTWYETFSGK